MQASEHVNLLVSQASKPGIGRMHMQRHLSLCEPLAQRFGVDGKQLTTINDGKTAHEKDSFVGTVMMLLATIGKTPGKIPWSTKQPMKGPGMIGPGVLYPAAQRRLV
jgi:hypothetical protein